MSLTALGFQCRMVAYISDLSYVLIQGFALSVMTAQCHMQSKFSPNNYFQTTKYPVCCHEINDIRYMCPLNIFTTFVALKKIDEAFQNFVNMDIT